MTRDNCGGVTMAPEGGECSLRVNKAFRSCNGHAGALYVSDDSLVYGWLATGGQRTGGTMRMTPFADHGPGASVDR